MHPQAMSSSQNEVVFRNGQFMVEERSCAVDLMPDIETSKRMFNSLRQQFDKYCLTPALFRPPYDQPYLVLCTVMRFTVKNSCSCCRK